MKVNKQKEISLEYLCDKVKHLLPDYEKLIIDAKNSWIKNSSTVEEKVKKVLDIVNDIKSKTYVGSETNTPAMYLYIYINTVNGKLYVGQTNNYVRRIKNHLDCSKNQKYRRQPIDKAIYKYGIEKFIIMPFLTINNPVLKTNDEFNEINNLEKFFIRIFNCYLDPKEGYNRTDGGESFVSILFSDEMIKNIIKTYTKKDENGNFCNSLRFIAKYYSVDYEVIKRILIENNIEIRNKYKSNSNIEMTLERELNVVKIYKEQNLSATKLSEMFKTSVPTIITILRKYNTGYLGIYDDYFKNKEDIDKLIYQYDVEKIGLKELEKIWNCSGSVLKRILINNNITIRTRYEQINVNLTFHHKVIKTTITRFTDLQIKDIINLYNKRDSDDTYFINSLEYIAKIYNVDKSIIKQILKNNEIKIRNISETMLGKPNLAITKRTPELVNLARKMKNEGMSYRQIAAMPEFNVAVTTICFWLNNY